MLCMSLGHSGLACSQHLQRNPRKPGVADGEVSCLLSFCNSGLGLALQDQENSIFDKGKWTERELDLSLGTLNPYTKERGGFVLLILPRNPVPLWRMVTRYECPAGPEKLPSVPGTTCTLSPGVVKGQSGRDIPGFACSDWVLDTSSASTFLDKLLNFPELHFPVVRSVLLRTCSEHPRAPYARLPARRLLSYPWCGWELPPPGGAGGWGSRCCWAFSPNPCQLRALSFQKVPVGVLGSQVHLSLRVISFLRVLLKGPKILNSGCVTEVKLANYHRRKLAIVATLCVICILYINITYIYLYIYMSYIYIAHTYSYFSLYV